MDAVQGLPNPVKQKLIRLRFPEAFAQAESGRGPQSAPQSNIPQLVPNAPPGAQGASGGPPQSPTGFRPEFSLGSFKEAMTTPLTAQFGAPTFQETAQKEYSQKEAGAPEWEKPLYRFRGGIEEAVGGAADTLLSPLGILFAGAGGVGAEGGKLAEELPNVAKAARGTQRALAGLFSGLQGKDAVQNIYHFLKTGDTSGLGKSLVEIPLSVGGYRIARYGSGKPSHGAPRLPEGREPLRLQAGHVSGERTQVEPEHQRSGVAGNPHRMGGGVTGLQIGGPEQPTPLQGAIQVRPYDPRMQPQKSGGRLKGVQYAALKAHKDHQSRLLELCRYAPFRLITKPPIRPLAQFRHPIS
jgi:hypothetical protein